MLWRRPGLAAWLLILPMLVVVVGVVGLPFLQAVGLSFTDARLRSGTAMWVGLSNYARLLGDEGFRAALARTLSFTFVSVGAELVLGILVGLLLDQRFVGRNLLRALMVLPWALPTVVNAMAWRLLYNPDFGALNAALTQLGIFGGYRSWLGDPAIAMNAVIVADVWKNYPIVALIVLAALQLVPRTLHEAAVIDGAGPWTRFRVVVWPAIVPALLVAATLRSIEALKVFDIVYVMTRGGPADTTKTLSFFVYQESFSFMRAGSGASGALILVLLAMALAAVYVRLLRLPGGAAA